MGGADGIISRLLKKSEEKPLSSRVNCHLLIFPMSLRNPWRPFGRPYNARFWQQLATVSDAAVGGSAEWPAFPRTPFVDSNGMVHRFYRASGLLREACRVGVQWNYVDERILDGGGK